MTPEGRQPIEELILEIRSLLPPSKEGLLVQDGWIGWHYRTKKWADRLALLLADALPQLTEKKEDTDTRVDHKP